MKKYSLNPCGIDRYLYAVEDSILRQWNKFDYPFPPSVCIAPLRWWISTGRASAATLKTLLSIRPDVIARCLLKGGTDCEVLQRVYDKIDAKIEHYEVN